MLSIENPAPIIAQRRIQYYTPKPRIRREDIPDRIRNPQDYTIEAILKRISESRITQEKNEYSIENILKRIEMNRRLIAGTSS